MLTPHKINELVKAISTKHTQPRNGIYPSHRKIMQYIARHINQIANSQDVNEVNKVKEMTNLLEGFIRYLNATSGLIKLDVDRILTYIYYPENQEITLQNKDNLMVGRNGETVRLWHDTFFKNNRGPILSRLIDLKNFLYTGRLVGKVELLSASGDGMPIQMKKKYEEMFKTSPNP